MVGKKMEKKQILKKSKMKVNQAEEKLIFYFFFFILVLQFTAIRWSTTRHHFLEIHIQSHPQVQLFTTTPLSFFPNTLVLHPSVFHIQLEHAGTAAFSRGVFTISWSFPWTTGSWRTFYSKPCPGFTLFHKDKPLWESGCLSPFHPYQVVCDQADEELSTGVRKAPDHIFGRFSRMLSSKCLITLHL